MTDRYQECPLCNSRVEYIEDFPHYVCNSCIKKALNENDEKVVFFHGHFNPNALQGYIRRNTELIPFAGNNCRIRGVICRAIYDCSNGVIIQPAYEVFSEEDLEFIPAFRQDKQPARWRVT